MAVENCPSSEGDPSAPKEAVGARRDELPMAGWGERDQAKGLGAAGRGENWAGGWGGGR